MRIYTKTGDGGTTSLIGGKRVSKCHPRVEAYGSVDELMAHISFLRDSMAENYLKNYGEELLTILNNLMTVAAIFACDDDFTSQRDAICENNISFLEGKIDAMTEAVPKINKFTLPGGHPLVSLAHIARTVCRRAERDATRVECSESEHIIAVRYLNRLSDYFYALGRKLAYDAGIEEILWTPGCK